MNRTTLTLMLLAATVAAAGFAGPLRADAPADLKAALDELKKEPASQNASLIDAKLVSAVAAPDALGPAQYQQARLLQEQRRVAALADKTEPQKRLTLSQSAIDIIAEIGKLFLGDDTPTATRRFDAYRAQLTLAAMITDSVRAKTIEADVVKTMLADLDGRYLTVASATVETKEAAIQAAVKNRDAIRDPAKRREFTLGVYDRYVPLGTVGAKVAIIERAKVRAAGGETDAAMKDFQLVLDDAQAGGDLKNLARTERMRFLAGQAMWKDAKADADIVSKLAVKDASGTVFTPAMAAEAKRQAIRVLLANSALDQAGYAAAMDQLCLEALGVENLTADEKSSVIADAFLERSADLAGRYQWDAALGWAKAAYETAPNAKVPGAVTLIQQVLANRTRKPLAKDSFNLPKDPKDIEAAAAFYARQTGTKKVIAASQPAETVVTLATNLSNQDQFPRQLTGVVAPYSDTFKAAVTKVAAEHADAMTRALANGLLGDPDKPIEVMSGAINALGLESPKVTPLTNFMARFVRAKFESVALANAFLESQVYGPAGKDGKLGTPDDKPNPLTAGKE